MLKSAKPMQWTLALVCILAMFVAGTPASAAETQARKIAVATEGPDEHAAISRQTARAPFVLIFDGSGNLLESIENPITVDRRAGPAMARWLSDKQVDTLIGGGIGRNLATGLETHRISGVEMSGSAADAVKDVLGR